MEAYPQALQKPSVLALGITHFNLEMAAVVRKAFIDYKPDCVAVELPETGSLSFLHAASRLPDISCVRAEGKDARFFLCESGEALFEALRSAEEAKCPAYCIDLDLEDYPDFIEDLPDPYAIKKIGYKAYYEAISKENFPASKEDHLRELYMARRLKELSFSYERILFVGGIAHIQRILDAMENKRFDESPHAAEKNYQVFC